jgi:hypothetical protein
MRCRGIVGSQRREFGCLAPRAHYRGRREAASRQGEPRDAWGASVGRKVVLTPAFKTPHPVLRCCPSGRS